MQSLYEQWSLNNNNNNNGNVGGNTNQVLATSSGLPTSYLNFIASTLSNNQDFLNSSQTDKNWLNNSLSLPPELRWF